jgi:hypothetical protein
MKILVAGMAGVYAERLLALRDAGHHLVYCTLTTDRKPDDFRGADLPRFQLPADTAADALRRIIDDFEIDVAYCLKNSWDGSPALTDLLLRIGAVPTVRHYKEHSARPDELERRTLLDTAAQIYINEESLAHFRSLYGVREDTAHILDTDYVPRRYLSDVSAEPEYDRDGRPHLVVPGSVSALGGRTDIRDLCRALTRRRVHVHIFGQKFIDRDRSDQWRAGAEPVRRAYQELVDGGYVHLHDPLPTERISAEWSRYDAGLMHLTSRDPREHAFQPMNQPNRVSTVLSAGLALAQQEGGQPAMERLVRRTGAGLLFRSPDELADLLEDRRAVATAREHALAVRESFTYEHHVPQLVGILSKYAGKS